MKLPVARSIPVSMPDRRRHRGPHPSDDALFRADRVPTLRRAVGDLSWLLTRGYADRSALKIVGDRYRLRERQRTAVMRCACGDDALIARAGRELSAASVAKLPLRLDGYNVLTTVEAALAGGVLLLARDGCLRDMASMHGHYRKVDETGMAIDLVLQTVEELDPGPVTWYLDAPVSNSGRLAATIRDRSSSWRVELVPDPDPVLARSGDPVATADSVVLDAPVRWFNLARHVVETRTDAPWIVDLRADG